MLTFPFTSSPCLHQTLTQCLNVLECASVKASVEVKKIIFDWGKWRFILPDTSLVVCTHQKTFTLHTKHPSSLKDLTKAWGQLLAYKLAVTRPISRDRLLLILQAKLLCLSKPEEAWTSLTPYSPWSLSDLHQSTHYWIISSRIGLHWTGIPSRVSWIGADLQHKPPCDCPLAPVPADSS